MERINGNLILDYCKHGGIINGIQVVEPAYTGPNQSPLVGVMGFGTIHERRKNKSAWIHAEILGPTFIRNNLCAGKSHIEGIVTEDGRARFLESVYDFPAHSGACVEYLLEIDPPTKINEPLKFIGELILRNNPKTGRKEEKYIGNVRFSLNTCWGDPEIYTSFSLSSPVYHGNQVTGFRLPDFWETFLREIEEAGFDHPYAAITDALKKEREEIMNEQNKELDLGPAFSDTTLENDGEVPF